jgi:hypothetical protein
VQADAAGMGGAYAAEVGAEECEVECEVECEMLVARPTEVCGTSMRQRWGRRWRR